MCVEKRSTHWEKKQYIINWKIQIIIISLLFAVGLGGFCALCIISFFALHIESTPHLMDVADD